MSEAVMAVEVGVEVGKASLSDLVNEAFIEPIRSVLIIDDKYPTWDRIFGEAGYDSKDTDTWTAKSKILEVIRQFRSKSPALTVDIHDGVEIDGIGAYLHQSDLLVLDYALEAQAPFGLRAAAIIDRLLSNSHFNLVVVHTADGLEDPFNNILMSLLKPTHSAETQVEKGRVLVEDMEDSGVEGSEGIAGRIKATLPLGAYLAFRKATARGMAPRNFIQTADEAQKFNEMCESVGWKIGQRWLVFLWATWDFEKTLSANGAALHDVRWRSPKDTARPWIRTSGGFIAFAEKENPRLLDVLREALEDWKPSPSRMISSKIRAEISARGVVAEDTALSDRRAHWRYYRELLDALPPGSDGAGLSQRKTMIQAHAARHTERLLDMIGETAVDFGLRVVDADPTSADPGAPGFASHYEGVESPRDDEKALNHYNAYISTKPVSGWHLQPGHVISIGSEHWVCVSPACDLVPMQKTGAGIDASATALAKAFMAVRLYPKGDAKRADVNSNSMVYWLDRSKDEVTCFSVYPGGGENGSPVWRLFSAEDYGKFTLDADRTADLKLSYVSGESKSLAIKNCDGRIVGQLRYEYALNLVQKLGTEFTRIGLDFVAPPA